jgi:TolB-like protein
MVRLLPLVSASIAVLACSLGAEVPAGASGRIGVQVLALQPESNVPRESTKLLTDFLVSELSRRPELQVFGQSDLETLLQAAKQDRKLECNSDADACLAEVAGAMGAQWLIGGNVGVLGDRLLINVRLTDTRHHQMLAHVSEETSGGTEDLLDAIKKLVPRLVDEAEAYGVVPQVAHKRTTAYWLLGTSIACAVGAGVMGGYSYYEYSQVDSAGQNYIYGRNVALTNAWALQGGYTQTKDQIEPWGIGAGIAIGIALALGIGTWVAW